MNQAIVKGINSKVKYDDVLYHLGDWSFGGIEQIWGFRKQINCQNIHLIFGNHDHHIEDNKLLKNPDTNHHVKELHSQNLFASTQYVKTIKAGGVRIFMSHFAHRVWDKSHHGAIHLYGHSHSTLEETPYGKSMDVGIDNYYRLFGKYEPFSLTQVLEIMNKRDVKLVDHHNKNTN